MYYTSKRADFLIQSPIKKNNVIKIQCLTCYSPLFSTKFFVEILASYVIDLSLIIKDLEIYEAWLHFA